MKKTIWLLCSALAMAILILDTKTAILGAQEGISLCLETVIPALFPLITVTTLLNSLLTGCQSKPISAVNHVMRIPKSVIQPLIIGLLGGYPTGAQCVSQLYEQGTFSASIASQLVSVCNNCGPAFLFGIIASQFQNPFAPWELWIILLIGNLICASLNPIPQSPPSPPLSKPALTCTQAVKIAIKTIASICGWIILMRVVITFLTRWFLWRFHSFWQVMICGFLELTNGAVRLHEIDNYTLRFIIASCLLSFGGCCVALQTYSVLHKDISFRYYFPGKLTSCIISTLLATIYQTIQMGQIKLCFISIIALSMIWIVGRKNSSNFKQYRI